MAITTLSFGVLAMSLLSVVPLAAFAQTNQSTAFSISKITFEGSNRNDDGYGRQHSTSGTIYPVGPITPYDTIVGVSVGGAPSGKSWQKVEGTGTTTFTYTAGNPDNQCVYKYEGSFKVSGTADIITPWSGNPLHPQGRVDLYIEPVPLDGYNAEVVSGDCTGTTPFSPLDPCSMVPRIDIATGKSQPSDLNPCTYTLNGVDTVVDDCDPEEVKKARAFFEYYIKEFQTRGWTVAASNLQDFVNGAHVSQKLIDSDWVRKAQGFGSGGTGGLGRDGELRIQQYFENGARGAKDKGLTEIAQVLKAGWTLTYPTEGRHIIWEAALGVGSYNNEWFWAIGHAELYGEGAFKLANTGNEVTITGIVNFRLHDMFDFDKGQPGYDQAEILKKCDKTKDYPIASYWTKVVSGTVNVQNGYAQYTWRLL